MQGLGAFSCLKSAWLGFHPQFRGFGGEEGYIHESFRQAGRKTLCLPWLRWMHRFGRPFGPRYLVTQEDRLRNYVIGHDELGLDLAPILHHFCEYMPEYRVIALAEQALGGRWTGSAFICEEESIHQEKEGRSTQTRAAAGMQTVLTLAHNVQESGFPLVSVVLPVYNGDATYGRQWRACSHKPCSSSRSFLSMMGRPMRHRRSS